MAADMERYNSRGLFWGTGTWMILYRVEDILLKKMSMSVLFPFLCEYLHNSGKSTIIKHIILSEYMKGTKIIIIDPEREYKELCENLKGDWINAGGSNGGLINPLEIRSAPRDEETEVNPLYNDEGNGMGDMALYLKTLEIFFSLYIQSLTDIQKALLKETLEELYFSFNIRWDTDVSKLQSTDFPTFKDLYNLIVRKGEDENSRDVSELKSGIYYSDRSVATQYSQLACLLIDIALGSDRFLWDGHRTLQANSRCICLSKKP